MSLGGVFFFAALAIIGFFLYQSTREVDPANKACAIEMAEAIRANRSISPSDLAAILRRHSRSPAQAAEVARMVAPRLRPGDAHDDERLHGMKKVREAVAILKRST